MKTEVIGKDRLPFFRDLILPSVYEELKRFPGDPETEYICLAASPEDQEGPASALVAQMEEEGDLNILSIFTLPEHRRRGLASFLVSRLLNAALGLFQWGPGETEAGIYLKTLYRLPPGAEAAYDAFLKKNGFTDFYFLEEDPQYRTWCAVAEVRFFKTGGT